MEQTVFIWDLDGTLLDSYPIIVQSLRQALAEQETAKVEAETALIKAQNEADIKVKEAEAEAKANKLKADSITDELIRMKEAEARLKHGWVTVQGNAATVIDQNK